MTPDPNAAAEGREEQGGTTTFPCSFIVIVRCCWLARPPLILIPFAPSPVIITRQVKPRAKHQQVPLPNTQGGLWPLASPLPGTAILCVCVCLPVHMRNCRRSHSRGLWPFPEPG